MNRLAQKKRPCVKSWNPEGEPVIHTKTNCYDFPEAKHLLELGADPRSQSTKPSREGYTLLHIACLKANIELVELLTTTYKVDASAVAADGFQPIHIAVFNNSQSIIRALLDATVNTETKITKAMFEKYYAPGSNWRQKRKRIWRNDFGDSITLVTYAVLYDNSKLVEILFDHDANLELTSYKNETLLMSAVNHRFANVVKYLLSKMTRKEINFTNNRGFTALHRIFPGSSFTEHKIDFEILKALVNGGADINSSIHGDPATLVTNMAAYLHKDKMLRFLLPRQRFSSVVKPLYYANLSFSEDYPSKYISFKRYNSSSYYYNYYPHALDTIVRHMKLRIAIGWPILPQEIQVMNNTKLILPIEDNYELLVDYLKNRKTIMFRGQETLVFEILSKKMSELREVAEDEQFLQALDKFHEESSEKSRHNEEMIAVMMKVRMEQALRSVFLNEVKKLGFFSETMFYYIPFDCTFEIAKYLSIDDLKSFIDVYNKQDD